MTDPNPPYANVLESGLDQLILVVAEEWCADIDEVEEVVFELMSDRCGWSEGDDEEEWRMFDGMGGQYE